jgi:nucleoside-diphosphate-sugar epimerase
MRVLVTGGAGFIGSHLADAFLARGDDVTVADDLSAGRPGRLAGRGGLHKVSICDSAALSALVSGARPQLICHLAAQIDVRSSVAAPAHDAEVNVIGTVNVLEAARAAGARVLFASSGGALDANRPGIWNIGTGTENSVLDLVQIIGGIAGRRLEPRLCPPRPGELARSVLDVSRASGELGWRPSASLAQGIRAVYRWIEAGAADRAPS